MALSAFGPGCVKTYLPLPLPRGRRRVSPAPLELCVETSVSALCHDEPPDASLAALMCPFLRVGGWLSRLDCLKKRGHTEYRQYPFEVVRQDMQAHLGAHLLEGFGLEVGITHPGFQGAEWMLDRLSSHAHPLWFSIQASFGGLEHGFMLPARHSPVRTGRALRLHGAGRTV